MAAVEYLLFCEQLSTTDTAKVSLIGIFDSLHAPQFPARHELMHVAIQMRGAPHEHITFAIELRQGAHLPLSRLDGAITSGPDGGAFVPVKFVGLVFPEPGVYSVSVLIDGRRVAAKPLQVRQNALDRQPAAAH